MDQLTCPSVYVVSTLNYLSSVSMIVICSALRRSHLCRCAYRCAISIVFICNYRYLSYWQGNLSRSLKDNHNATVSIRCCSVHLFVVAVCRWSENVFCAR